MAQPLTNDVTMYHAALALNSVCLLVRMLLTGGEVRLGLEARILWRQHPTCAGRLAVITAAALHHNKTNAGGCEMC